MSLLTIAIPTYNRSSKVARLIHALGPQLREAGVKGKVRILVSDNGSTDATSQTLAQAGLEPALLRIHRQPSNVGVFRNMAWLYENCETEYLWYFADDDLPLPGAVAKVVDAIERRAPRLLIFSFIQPPGSTQRHIDFPEPVRIIEEVEESARLILKCGKLSNFVYQRVPLTPLSREFLKATIEEGKAGYYHCVLAVSLLEAQGGGKMAAISEALATCDEDYRVLRTSAADWAHLGRVGEHPYVREKAPRLAAELSPASGYRAQIGVLWAWRCGKLDVDDSYRQEYEAAARQPLQLGALAAEPAALARALVLRFFPARAPQLVHRLAQALKGGRAR